MSKRKLIFLKDVILFTFTAFGGAQAHIGMMLKNFCKKRAYITEEELLDLYALTQVLPGPASTQTLVGVAYKVGGLRLAIITFLIWVTPSAVLMAIVAVSLNALGSKTNFETILTIIQPMAIGIVAYSVYSFAKIVLKSRSAIFLAVSALMATLILRNAYVFPIMILIGGIVSSALETPIEETQLKFSLFSNINTKKVVYFTGILLLFAALGALINRTSPFSLPIRMFENFYRNGILIFGGGNVLIPLMYTEFVDMKHYLSATDFLSGFAFQQILPGPTFSFTAFLGTIAFKNFGYGNVGQFFGGMLATFGINLPGLILVLFIVPFWNDLKKISRIKYSLHGINAVSLGFLGAAFLLLFYPIGGNITQVIIVILTFLLLTFTKIKTPILMIGGIVVGYLVLG